MRIDLQTWQKKTLGVLIVVAAIAMVLVSVGATFMGLRRHAFVLYPQRVYNGPDVYSHSNGMASSPVVVVPTKGSFNPYTSAQPSAYTGSAYSRPAPSASPMAVAVPLKTTSVTTHNRTAAPLGKGSAGVVTTSSRTTHSVGGGGVNGGMATTSSRSGNNQSQGLTPSAGSSVSIGMLATLPTRSRTIESNSTYTKASIMRKLGTFGSPDYGQWINDYFDEYGRTNEVDYGELWDWFHTYHGHGDGPCTYSEFEEWVKEQGYALAVPVGDSLWPLFLLLIGYIILRKREQRIVNA